MGPEHSSPDGRHGSDIGTLFVASGLTFNSDATYKLDLSSRNANADEVVANGVSITAAQFSFTDVGFAKLPHGAVFTVIDNTSAAPIAGTFNNLADDATFTRNGNTFKAHYEGGDGNDLTLTVQ
jgi:hypothetical protein